MRILGIDPGTALVGWAIVDQNEKDVAAHAYGHIETHASSSLPERLLDIAKDLESIIAKYKPQEAAVEDLFFFKNHKTAMAVSHARGVTLLCLQKAKIGIAEYTPLQVKQALTGYGRADKKQIQQMVKNVLALKKIPTPDDTADALAVALCHAQSRNFSQKINS